MGWACGRCDSRCEPVDDVASETSLGSPRRSAGSRGPRRCAARRRNLRPRSTILASPGASARTSSSSRRRRRSRARQSRPAATAESTPPLIAATTRTGTSGRALYIHANQDNLPAAQTQTPCQGSAKSFAPLAKRAISRCRTFPNRFTSARLPAEPRGRGLVGDRRARLRPRLHSNVRALLGPRRRTGGRFFNESIGATAKQGRGRGRLAAPPPSSCSGSRAPRQPCWSHSSPTITTFSNRAGGPIRPTALIAPTPGTGAGAPRTRRPQIFRRRSAKPGKPGAADARSAHHAIVVAARHDRR
jgi:hypothetical protein